MSTSYLNREVVLPLVKDASQKCMEESKAVMQRHMTLEAVEYSNDIIYRGLVTEMLNLKSYALIKFNYIMAKLRENTIFMDHVLFEYPLRVSYRHCMVELVRQLERNPSEVQAVELCKNYDLLLDNVEERNELGETPLHAACSDGVGEDRIRLLALAGADVNCASTNGMTPLLSSSNFGRSHLVSMLVV
jgi:ankyrin repeat protein